MLSVLRLWGRLRMWTVSFLLSSFSYSMDLPGEFVQNSGGKLSTSGLSWESASPARFAEPGFGIAYARMVSADVWNGGVSGEFGLGNSRIAFSSSYLEMDSLYRRVYSELDFSFCRSWFILGAGYGFSVEWIPRDEKWNRHRYKTAATFIWKGLSVGGVVLGFSDVPLKEADYVLGFRYEVSQRFGMFAEWDGAFFDVGNEVCFSFVRVRSAYRFPDFGVAVSLDFLLGDWSVDGTYGFVGRIWDWFGFSVSKKQGKKTIL